MDPDVETDCDCVSVCDGDLVLLGEEEGDWLGDTVSLRDCVVLEVPLWVPLAVLV